MSAEKAFQKQLSAAQATFIAAHQAAEASLVKHSPARHSAATLAGNLEWLQDGADQHVRQVKVDTSGHKMNQQDSEVPTPAVAIAKQQIRLQQLRVQQPSTEHNISVVRENAALDSAEPRLTPKPAPEPEPEPQAELHSESELQPEPEQEEQSQRRPQPQPQLEQEKELESDHNPKSAPTPGPYLDQLAGQSDTVRQKDQAQDLSLSSNSQRLAESCSNTDHDSDVPAIQQLHQNQQRYQQPLNSFVSLEGGDEVRVASYCRMCCCT